MVTIDELAEECGITVAGVKWQLQQNAAEKSYPPCRVKERWVLGDY